MKASNPPADAPIPTIENAPHPACATPVLSREREGGSEVGEAFDTGFLAVTWERDDETLAPGLLRARIDLLFPEECSLISPRLDFIGD
jgi:hypothetical protein